MLWIAASVAAAAAANPNGIKTLLPNGLSKGKPVFNNGSRSLPKIPSDWAILDNWVCWHFILAVEPFAKGLRIFETCVLV